MTVMPVASIRGGVGPGRRGRVGADGDDLVAAGQHVGAGTGAAPVPSMTVPPVIRISSLTDAPRSVRSHGRGARRQYDGRRPPRSTTPDGGPFPKPAPPPVAGEARTSRCTTRAARLGSTVDPMDLELNGRRAAVAASSSGLGLGVARALAAEGCTVVMNGRDEDRLDAAAAIGARRRARSRATSARWRAPRRSWPRPTELLGGVDILVTNAGGPPPGTFASTVRGRLRARARAQPDGLGGHVPRRRARHAGSGAGAGWSRSPPSRCASRSPRCCCRTPLGPG